MVIALLLALCSTAAVFYPLSDEARLISLFPEATYWILWACVGLWITALVQFLRANNFCWRSFLSENWSGFVASLALVLIISQSVSPMFRIFIDEVDMMADSRSLAFEQRAEFDHQAVFHQEELTAVSTEVGIRPFLYQFLVHIGHMVRGYRIENAYLVNYILLFLLLSSSFCFIRARFGVLFGLSAVLLIVSQPIVSLYASSGSFDLCASVFLLFSFISLVQYFKAPSSSSMMLLFSNLVMLAHARFESIIFLTATGVLLLALRAWKTQYLRPAALYALAPVLLAPVVWQRFIHRGIPVLPESVQLFSFSHFLENNAVFFRQLLVIDSSFPFAVLVNLLGMLAIAKVALSARSSEQPNFLITSLGVGLIGWILITAHFWSEITDFFVARHYLPYAIIFSLMGTRALHELFQRFRLHSMFALGASAAIFLFYFPIAQQQSRDEVGIFAQRYYGATNFLRTRGKPDSLVIGDAPEQYIIHGHPAVTFDYAEVNAEKILKDLKLGVYRDVLVLQNIRPKDGQPVSVNRLKPRWELEPLREIEYNDPMRGIGAPYLRISRVIGSMSLALNGEFYE